MPKLKKFLQIFILTIFIFSVSFAEEKLPYFKFETDKGNFLKKSQLKGKPSVLIFWGIYCHTCKDELPRLEKLYQKYKDKVNFLAIVVDTRDIDEIKEYKKKIGFSYPVLFINSQSDLIKFKIFGTPTTLLVSPDLKVIKRYIGDIDLEKFEEDLKKLIN